MQLHLQWDTLALSLVINVMPRQMIHISLLKFKNQKKKYNKLSSKKEVFIYSVNASFFAETFLFRSFTFYLLLHFCQGQARSSCFATLTSILVTDMLRLSEKECVLSLCDCSSEREFIVRLEKRKEDGICIPEKYLCRKFFRDGANGTEGAMISNPFLLSTAE